MRPSGKTAVASMVRSAAPESARWPRWMTCQSVMQPSTAEYWHIGAMTMRLRSSTLPTRNGVKRVLIEAFTNAYCAIIAPMPPGDDPVPSGFKPCRRIPLLGHAEDLLNGFDRLGGPGVVHHVTGLRPNESVSEGRRYVWRRANECGGREIRTISGANWEARASRIEIGSVWI